MAKNIKHYVQRAEAKTYLKQVRGQHPEVDDYVRMLLANAPEVAVGLEQSYEEYAEIFGLREEVSE